jgi:hypothetical protein
MQSSQQNQLFEGRRGEVSQFSQTTVGFDLRLSYLYYELNAEYIINNFNAPYLIIQGGDDAGSGLQGKSSVDLGNREFLADLKIEAPFYPGLFLAIRFDRLTSSEIQDPSRTSSTYMKSIPWNHPVERVAIGLGYKPERSVLIKVAYEKTDIDVNPAPELDYIACALVVTF